MENGSLRCRWNLISLWQIKMQYHVDCIYFHTELQRRVLCKIIESHLVSAKIRRVVPLPDCNSLCKLLKIFVGCRVTVWTIFYTHRKLPYYISADCFTYAWAYIIIWEYISRIAVFSQYCTAWTYNRLKIFPKRHTWTRVLEVTWIRCPMRRVWSTHNFQSNLALLRMENGN